jgi:Rrf2 family protein
MKVSMKGDYGVRALVELAHHFGESPVQSAVIASRQAIPEPYLDQLLTSLRRAGIIRSVRGPNGGHALLRDPRGLKLSEVIIALEGSLAPISCLDDPAGCPKAIKCCVHSVWEEVHQATLKVLDGITVEDLATKEREANVARYSI